MLQLCCLALIVLMCVGCRVRRGYINIAKPRIYDYRDSELSYAEEGKGVFEDAKNFTQSEKQQVFTAEEGIAFFTALSNAITSGPAESPTFAPAELETLVQEKVLPAITEQTVPGMSDASALLSERLQDISHKHAALQGVKLAYLGDVDYQGRHAHLYKVRYDIWLEPKRQTYWSYPWRCFHTWQGLRNYTKNYNAEVSFWLPKILDAETKEPLIQVYAVKPEADVLGAMEALANKSVYDTTGKFQKVDLEAEMQYHREREELFAELRRYPVTRGVIDSPTRFRFIFAPRRRIVERSLLARLNPFLHKYKTEKLLEPGVRTVYAYYLIPDPSRLKDMLVSEKSFESAAKLIKDDFANISPKDLSSLQKSMNLSVAEENIGQQEAIQAIQKLLGGYLGARSATRQADFRNPLEIKAQETTERVLEEFLAIKPDFEYGAQENKDSLFAWIPFLFRETLIAIGFFNEDFLYQGLRAYDGSGIVQNGKVDNNKIEDTIFYKGFVEDKSGFSWQRAVRFTIFPKWPLPKTEKMINVNGSCATAHAHVVKEFEKHLDQPNDVSLKIPVISSANYKEFDDSDKDVLLPFRDNYYDRLIPGFIPELDYERDARIIPHMFPYAKERGNELQVQYQSKLSPLLVDLTWDNADLTSASLKLYEIREHTSPPSMPEVEYTTEFTTNTITPTVNSTYKKKTIKENEKKRRFIGIEETVTEKDSSGVKTDTTKITIDNPAKSTATTTYSLVASCAELQFIGLLGNDLSAGRFMFTSAPKEGNAANGKLIGLFVVATEVAGNNTHRAVALLDDYPGK